MEVSFISKLKPLLDCISEQMELYVPVRADNHFVFSKYDNSKDQSIELNNIRSCTPIKEFLFPVREVAAVYPSAENDLQLKPFAVFGLKDCDIRSIDILDKVFADEEFKDDLYLSHREKMFIISSDCFHPGESCFCGIFDGKGHCNKGFDLNVSKIKDGFIIEAGSKKGHDFIENHSHLFADVPKVLLDERQRNRQQVQNYLSKKNTELKINPKIKELVESSKDSQIYYTAAKGCIECQGCTRICPTCHCFYLYDQNQKEYFAKMKIWDSCMRFTYSAVAGGANPNKVLADRLRHRLMHKFVYFLERYGVNMCVGCGRCVDAEAGEMDLITVLKRLSLEIEKEKVQGLK